MVGYSKTTSLCVNGNKYGIEKKIFMILSAFLDLRPRVLLRDMNLCYAFLFFPFQKFLIFQIFVVLFFYGALVLVKYVIYRRLWLKAVTHKLLIIFLFRLKFTRCFSGLITKILKKSFKNP